MKDFIFNIFSTIFQMDMTNPHDIPFAMPLMMACMIGGLIGFTIVRFISDEHKRDSSEYRKED